MKQICGKSFDEMSLPVFAGNTAGGQWNLEMKHIFAHFQITGAHFVAHFELIQILYFFFLLAALGDNIGKDMYEEDLQK